MRRHLSVQAQPCLASRGSSGAHLLRLDSIGIRQIESEMFSRLAKCTALTVNSIWRGGNSELSVFVVVVGSLWRIVLANCSTDSGCESGLHSLGGFVRTG